MDKEQSQIHYWAHMLDECFDKNMLTEGKHWPEDYEKTAYNLIKQSKLGQQSWYLDKYIRQDVETFVDEFRPLTHKSSNYGFFMPIIRWFIEYSGDSKQKYQEFIESKLGTVISALLKIRNDKSYDSKVDEIKKMDFASFERLANEVNSQLSGKKIETTRSDARYKVVPIYSYEQMNRLYGGLKTGYKTKNSAWCHTNGKNTYDSWIDNGLNMFFVIEQDGWQKIRPPDPQMASSAYDEYGMSLIAILVDIKTGKLLKSTLRWNHVVPPPSGDADQAFESWEQLDDAVGFDVKKVCEDETKDLKKELLKRADEANAEVAKILSNAKTIDENTIPNDLRKRITNVDIPDSVKSIGDWAFGGCSGLTSVTIPNSVTSIEDYAFSGCSSLTSVTIPASVTSIEDYAFSGCSGLTSVTIGNGVMRIGNSAFSHCSGLTSVTIGNGVTSIGVDAFFNCTNLTSVTIPNSMMSIGDSAFFNCTNLTSVKIPDSVTSIGVGAFYGCSDLTSVTIPNSVTSIKTYAFYKCKSLKNLIFEGKTFDEVKHMKYYPWGIEDESIIRCEK